MLHGLTLTYSPQEGDPVELEILSTNGPLCVAYVFNHTKHEVVKELYWIYVTDYGVTIGPFFAKLSMANTAMKKILKAFKPPTFKQPLSWLRRQTAMADWISKNIGKKGDLIGGEWAEES